MGWGKTDTKWCNQRVWKSWKCSFAVTVICIFIDHQFIWDLWPCHLRMFEHPQNGSNQNSATGILQISLFQLIAVTPESPCCCIQASLALSRLLFMVYLLADRKESVHSQELWDAFAANCHPSTERSPGKVVPDPKTLQQRRHQPPVISKSPQASSPHGLHATSAVLWVFSPSGWMTFTELLIQQQKPKDHQDVFMALRWTDLRPKTAGLHPLARPRPQDKPW